MKLRLHKYLRGVLHGLALCGLLSPISQMFVTRRDRKYCDAVAGTWSDLQQIGEVARQLWLVRGAAMKRALPVDERAALLRAALRSVAPRLPASDAWYTPITLEPGDRNTLMLRSAGPDRVRHTDDDQLERVQLEPSPPRPYSVRLAAATFVTSPVAFVRRAR